MVDAPANSIERAYRIWRECGQNLTETSRILEREHGYPISRRSLHEWKKKYGWEERAARDDAARDEKSHAASDDSLLTVLLNQKKKYEGYFDTLPLGAVDNQAIYAYNNILKTLLDIRERTDASLNAKAESSGSGNPERIIKTPADAVDALDEAVNRKLNRLLADPSTVSLKAIQEVEKVLGMIDKMRAKYSAGKKKEDHSLTADAIKAIREQLKL